MPLPAGVETVTVSSGEPLTLPDGTAMRGRLIFTGPDLVTIGEDDVILGGTVEVPLVAYHDWAERGPSTMRVFLPVM